MAAATPSLIQPPLKQAVLSPTSTLFHVQTISTHMSSHTRPEAHENAPYSRQDSPKHNILSPDVKQYPSNTVQIEPKRKANVKRM